MKKILVILLAITTFFTGLAVTRGRDSIVVYSCLEQFRNDDMTEQLQEEFPDKDIIVVYMATGKAASKIYGEGEKTEADMVIGLETGYLNKIKGVLADISGLITTPYVDGLKPEDCGNLWTIWDKQAGAIIYNTDILQKHGLPAPTSYQDLLNPIYKGLVAMPDPKSSGTGYFFYKSWVNAWGDANALAYVDELYKNLKQFTESGSGPINLLKQQEIAVGLALTFQAVNEFNGGQPLAWTFDSLGSPYSLTGSAIVKGHEDKKDVKEVYQFIINKFLVHDKTYYSPETVFVGQTNNIANYPKGTLYADMTGIQDDVEKARLLDMWKY